MEKLIIFGYIAEVKFIKGENALELEIQVTKEAHF
jgi:hypothetical protein